MRTSNTAPIERVLDRLEKVRANNGYFMALCPAHDDKEPSLSVSEGDYGKVLVKCHAGCAAEDVISSIGMRMSDLFECCDDSGGGARTPLGNTATAQPCNLEVYAAAKRLPVDFLKALGLSDIHYDGRPAIRMPYSDLDGTEAAMRFRLALEKSPNGDGRFRWRKGSKPCLYGLWRLDEMKEAGFAVLVEGESDAQTLWYHGEPALGVPSAGTWADEWAACLDGVPVVYAVIEPDGGGDTFRQKLSASRIRDRLRLVEIAEHVDVSGLHLSDPQRFAQNWKAALEAAVPLTERERVEAEARKRGVWDFEVMRKNGEVPREVGRLLSEIEVERVGWLWRGRIPKGKLTLMDGDPGLGKSAVATDFSARVSAGRFWPDGAPCEAGGVVICSAEDGLSDTIKPRLVAAGGNPEKVLALAVVEDDHGDRLLSIPEDLDVLRRGIERVDASIVIVDPLMAFLSGGTNSHRDQDVRRALAPLARLAEETATAVLVVRHLNKASGGNPLYRGGGSIGIVGAARSALLVAKHPEDGELRVLAPLKCNLARPAASLAFGLAEADEGAVRVEWKGETPHTADALLAAPLDPEERSALEEAKEFLREALKDGPRWSKVVQDEARELGISEITLKRAKKVLGVRSEKEADGSWTWLLP